MSSTNPLGTLAPHSSPLQVNALFPFLDSSIVAFVDHSSPCIKWRFQASRMLTSVERYAEVHTLSLCTPTYTKHFSEDHALIYLCRVIYATRSRHGIRLAAIGESYNKGKVAGLCREPKNVSRA